MSFISELMKYILMSLFCLEIPLLNSSQVTLPYSFTDAIKLSNIDLEQNIPAVDTPQQHQHFPRSPHTQYPTHCLCRSPLCLHLQCYLQLVAADQFYKELVVQNMKLAIIVCVQKHSLDQYNGRTYLHTPHQHQQSGGSCVTGLVCWGTLVAGQHLRYTEHHPGRLVHCQHQSGHCCMPCHLNVNVQGCRQMPICI